VLDTILSNLDLPDHEFVPESETQSIDAAEISETVVAKEAEQETEPETEFVGNPESAEDWYNWGNDCRRQGNFPQAIQGYRKTIALDRDKVQAYCNLAGIMFEMGKQEDAEDILRLALQIAPGNAMIANNISGVRRAIRKRRN